MIIICEPQCIGFEHVEVNAALLTVIKYAFSDEEIMFVAEKEHIIMVQKILDSNSIHVIYKEIEVPPSNRIDILRFPSEFKLIKKVFELAKDLNSNKIIFSSIRRPGIIFVKLELRKFKNIRCIIVLHSIIEAVSKYPFEITEIPFWLRFWISFANNRSLRYLVLGPSIKNNLLKKLPNLKRFVTSIDHPYFYQSINQKKLIKDNTIRFGFFGVGSFRKGVDVFFKLAKDIKDETTRYKSEFILIGPIVDKGVKKIEHDSVVVPSPDKPLSRELYGKYAENIDYAIICHKEDEYQLSANGSFFDAISHLKPVIAQKNPFVEYYFNKMGNIGYLCNNYNEMKKIIICILETNSTKNYENQIENLLDLRDDLSFTKISKQLTDIWDNMS
jgi:hypothetical protein